MGGLLTGNYAKESEPNKNSHLASAHAQRAKNKYWNNDNFNMIEQLKSIEQKTGYNPISLTIAWTLSKPAINFNNVVLPLPEGPRIHAIESFFNSKLTSFKIGLVSVSYTHLTLPTKA